MQINVQIFNGKAVIKLHGQFVFSANRDFRQSCNSCLEAVQVREIELDMGGVDYLDSSALGMLLLLKERADAMGKCILLSNSRGTVAQVLDLANFGQIFRILPAPGAAPAAALAATPAT